MTNKQNTSTVMMIRPVRFEYNAQTAITNAFQSNQTDTGVQFKALAEFDDMVNTLRAHGIKVIVIDDTPEPHTPDSIFPNNWISMHSDGSVVLYPMEAPNRRVERRTDIIHQLSTQFDITRIIDWSEAEQKGKFLEGTGSMVLDRENNICYACISPRSHPDLVRQFCDTFQFTPVLFHAFDKNNLPIYHTNVVMCVGKDFIVICMESITNKEEQHKFIQSAGRKKMITITLEQLYAFAGNMLELENTKGEKILVMSRSAYHSLTPTQITELSEYAHLLPVNLDTIETNGGGSARCMLAEVFLPVHNTSGQ